MTGLKLTGLFTGEEQRSMNTSNHFIREVVSDSKDEGPIPCSPNQGREGQTLEKSLWETESLPLLLQGAWRGVLQGRSDFSPVWLPYHTVAGAQTCWFSSELSQAVGLCLFWCPLQSAAWVSGLLCTLSQSCWLWELSFLRLSITNKLCGRPQASWKSWSSTLAVLSSLAPGEYDSPADLILGSSLWFQILFGQQKTEVLPCFSKVTRDSRYQVWDRKCQTCLPRNSWKDHQHCTARKPMPLFHYSITCPVSYAASGCF